MSAFSATAVVEELVGAINTLREENEALRQSLLNTHKTLEMAATSGAFYARTAENLRESVIRWASRAEQAEGLLESIGAGGVGSPVTQRDTIPMPRAVVEQTLDALKSAKHRITEAGGTGWKLSAQGCINSITALREALAQPTHTAQHLNMVPEGWALVPVEPTTEMLDAYVQLQGKFNSARSDWAAMLAAAPKPPAIEQRSRYLDGGSRYKVTHLKTSGYCVIGLPAELLGQWVALVDATDNKHMDNKQPPVATDRQYPLPDDLYGGSKDWRAGSYHERVEWLHLGYESAKERIAELEQPPVVEQPLKDQLVDWPEVDRLLKTVKYLIGIAERGTVRKMRDDETVEQFVLSYVQALEQQQGEAFCFCDNDISLQSVSGGGAPEGLYGRITLKIGSEFVSYVKEQPKIEQEPAAYATHDTEGSPSMLFFDRREAESYCDDGEEPTPLYAHTLPQVEQEPVASIYIADNGEREFDDWRHDLPVGRNYLYTHPQNLNCKSNQARLATLWGYEKPQPPRQPLTDEEIAYCIFEARLGAEGAFKRNGSSSYRIARAIERAHGIGGEA